MNKVTSLFSQLKDRFDTTPKKKKLIALGAGLGLVAVVATGGTIAMLNAEGAFVPTSPKAAISASADQGATGATSTSGTTQATDESASTTDQAASSSSSDSSKDGSSSSSSSSSTATAAAALLASASSGTSATSQGQAQAAAPAKAKAAQQVATKSQSSSVFRPSRAQAANPKNAPTIYLTPSHAPTSVYYRGSAISPSVRAKASAPKPAAPAKQGGHYETVVVKPAWTETVHHTRTRKVVDKKGYWENVKQPGYVYFPRTGYKMYHPTEQKISDYAFSHGEGNYTVIGDGDEVKPVYHPEQSHMVTEPYDTYVYHAAVTKQVWVAN